MNPRAPLCRDDRVGQSFPPFPPSFCFNKSSHLLRLNFLFAPTKSPSPRLNHAEPSFESRRALACFSSSLRPFSKSPIAPIPFPNGFANRSLRFTARPPFAVPPCFSSFPPSYNIIRCLFCVFFRFFCLFATFLHFLAKKSL